MGAGAAGGRLHRRKAEAYDICTMGLLTLAPLNREHSSTAPQSVAAESALIDKRRARRRRAFQTLCRGTRAGDWLDCALECVGPAGHTTVFHAQKERVKSPSGVSHFREAAQRKKSSSAAIRSIPSSVRSTRSNLTYICPFPALHAFVRQTNIPRATICTRKCRLCTGKNGI